MYSERDFKEAKHDFSPFDKIHVAIELSDLAPGEYSLTTDWITPLGNLEQQSTHTFFIKKKKATHLVFSWLKLHRKGKLKRVLTGSEFKEEFYGGWKVRLFLNGTNVFTTRFNVL